MNEDIPIKPGLENKPMNFSASFDVVELSAGFEDGGDSEGVEMGLGSSDLGVEIEGGCGLVVLDVGGDEEVEERESGLGLGFEGLGVELLGLGQCCGLLVEKWRRRSEEGFGFGEGD